MIHTLCSFVFKIWQSSPGASVVCVCVCVCVCVLTCRQDQKLPTTFGAIWRDAQWRV